jgi:UDP-3-O-[3-hydroxymyristoyl] glucosamine N-acyltransferase
MLPSQPSSRVSYRLAELAALIGAQVEGNGEREISGLQALENAGPQELSFVTDPKYRARAEASSAGALLVGPAFAGWAGRDLLVAEQPQLALVRLLELFHPAPQYAAGIHPTAVVAADAEIDPSAHLGPYVVIGERSRIGARSAILSHAVIGRDCVVEEDCLLHPHSVLYDHTVVGARAILQAGAVLGSDGFGYASDARGHHRIPQVGRVVLGEDVDIGVNTAIDRATLGETRVGKGSKIDNLVQVGHNVQIGSHCILCGHVGIAGSTKLGDRVVLGGAVGVGDHLELGDGVQAAGRAGIRQSQPAGAQVNGDPAVDIRLWRRRVTLIAHLDEMRQRLRAVEKRLAIKSEEDGRE